MLVIWYDITNTEHTQWPVHWHTNINKNLCAHSSYLYCTERIFHWYQKFIFYNVFSIQKLFTCKSHICWLDAIKLDSSCETQIILIETVQINKTYEDTHTKHSEKDNTEEG